MPNDRDYAIVIGIKDYRELRPLQGPVQDANDFTEWLLDPAGGGLSDHRATNGQKHVFLIHSDPNQYTPLQNDIDNALGEIIRSGQNTGFRRFYFFFAGHGLGIDWKDNALCLPIWSNMFRNAALSSAEYVNVAVNSGLFPEVYFFLDCCRDRSVGVRGLHPTIGWPEAGNGAANCQSLVAYGAKFLNAASENVHWDQNKVLVNGYFTRALLLGLRGGANNQYGQITVNSLKSFLKTKVEELTDADNLEQSVQFEDRFDPNAVIVGNVQPNITHVTIRFTEPGEFVLLSPDLTEKKRETNPPAPWEIDLLKGSYCIRNIIRRTKDFFMIDGTEKNLTYEYIGKY